MKESFFKFCNISPLRFAILAIAVSVCIWACASTPPPAETTPAEVKQKSAEPKSTSTPSSSSSRVQQPATSTPSAVSQTKPEESAIVYVVITAKTNLRAEPKSKSKIIAKLKKGEKAVKLSTSGSWINVELTDQTTGWVLKKYTREEK